MRVLLVDKLAVTVVSRLEGAGCTVVEEQGVKGPELTARLAALDPDVLVVRSTKVLAEHLTAAPSLSLVIRAGAGVDNIEMDTANARGIYVANCPGKNAIAVAELAMGHLINLDRRITDNVTALRAHRWAKADFSKARGLYGRTLAVLGTGGIGRELIKRAQAFGMIVRGWDKALDPRTAAALGIQHCATAREACKGADALSVHLALTPETRGLIGAEHFEALRPGAYFINTSRGEVVDQDALLAAVRSRGLRAGLDVFAVEPAKDGPYTEPIADEPNVYGTHHIGASTDQASDAVADEVIRIIEVWLSSGRVENCVNLESSPPATHLLVIRHADRVGVLATVLGHLREAGCSVQNMENIVFKGAAAACARIQLDRAPSYAHLARIKESTDIFATSLVALESSR